MCFRTLWYNSFAKKTVVYSFWFDNIWPSKSADKYFQKFFSSFHQNMPFCHLLMLFQLIVFLWFLFFKTFFSFESFLIQKCEWFFLTTSAFSNFSASYISFSLFLCQLNKFESSITKHIINFYMNLIYENRSTFFNLTQCDLFLRNFFNTFCTSYRR